MRYISIFLIYLVSFLVQSTFLGGFRLFGASANLVLVLTMVETFCFGGLEGIFLGIVFGLVQDICFGPITGVSSLMYIVVGLFMQLLRNSVYKDNKLVLIVITVISTLVFYCGSWIVYNVFTSVFILLFLNIFFYFFDCFCYPVTCYWWYCFTYLCSDFCCFTIKQIIIRKCLKSCTFSVG